MIFAPIFWFIDTLLLLFLYVMLARMIMGFLFMMEIVSPRQPVANQIYDFTVQITEPVIRPVRRVVPAINAIDLPFLITGLLIVVVRSYLTMLAGALITA